MQSNGDLVEEHLIGDHQLPTSSSQSASRFKVTASATLCRCMFVHSPYLCTLYLTLIVVTVCCHLSHAISFTTRTTHSPIDLSKATVFWFLFWFTAATWPWQCTVSPYSSYFMHSVVQSNLFREERRVYSYEHGEDYTCHVLYGDQLTCSAQQLSGLLVWKSPH